MKILIGFMVLLISGPALANSTPDSVADSVAENSEYLFAPDFILNDIHGNEIALTDLLLNGPVYLEFWDLHCKNCIQELDALKPIYDSLVKRGLQIVAVSVDKPSDEGRVKSFVKSKRWPYVILLDQQQEVKRDYGVIIKPTAYLINIDSEIVYTSIGYKKGDERRLQEEFLRWLPNPNDSTDTQNNKE